MDHVLPAARAGSAWCPRSRLETCWCFAGVALKPRRTVYAAPTRLVRARRALSTHRRRARSARIAPFCNANSDGRDAGSSSSGNEYTEGDGSDASEPLASGDFTDPKLFVDMDLLRRRIREVEMSPESDEDKSSGEGSGNTPRIEINVEVPNVETSEEAGRLIEALQQVKEMYVIVFTARSSESGVYSLELNGENIVLAFQERSEAHRYAKLLELQQKFPSAKVCRLESKELRDFCMREGHRLGFVPRGSLSLSPPPESAVEDRSQWGVGESAGSDGAGGAVGEVGMANNSDNDGSSGLSKSELELYKKRLNDLFGL